jgi:hypothetical protein
VPRNVTRVVLVDELAEQSPAIDAGLQESRLIDELDLHGALQRGARRSELVEHVLQQVRTTDLNVRDLTLLHRLMHLFVGADPVLQQRHLLFRVQHERDVTQHALEALRIGLEQHERLLCGHGAVLGPHTRSHRAALSVSHRSIDLYCRKSTHASSWAKLSSCVTPPRSCTKARLSALSSRQYSRTSLSCQTCQCGTIIYPQLT